MSEVSTLCSKCGEVKPLQDFSKATKRPSGRQPWCKACRKSYAQSYYTRNKEELASKTSEYRRQNLARVTGWIRTWNSLHLDVVKVHDHNTRAKRLGVEGRLSRGIVGQLLHLQNRLCACCQEPLGDSYEIDHILPFFLGGKNLDTNVQLLLPLCNQQKGKSHPDVFLARRRQEAKNGNA